MTTPLDVVNHIQSGALRRPHTALLVGDIVDCVIGTQFLPNQSGDPIHLHSRGRLTQWDRHGNAIVEWPDGTSYSYEAALLRHSI